MKSLLLSFFFLAIINSASAALSTTVNCDPIRVGVNDNKSKEIAFHFSGNFEEILTNGASFDHNKSVHGLQSKIVKYHLLDEYTTESGGFVSLPVFIKIYSVKLQLNAEEEIATKATGCIIEPTKEVVSYLICRETTQEDLN
ncbi:MAG: hypothetical protein HQK52_21995 [Oligoflexia bacterium]|nr:hypothetical protein [Oligoflexia bacterium]